MEPKEDKRAGYYIVARGTNHRFIDGQNQSWIGDTVDIAQDYIDRLVELRKQMGLKQSINWTPQSIAEYNKKYVVGGVK